MSLSAKFVVRTVSVAVVSFLTVWLLAHQSSQWSLLAAAVIAGLDKVIELIGPGSDVGIKWTWPGSS